MLRKPPPSLALVKSLRRGKELRIRSFHRRIQIAFAAEQIENQPVRACASSEAKPMGNAKSFGWWFWGLWLRLIGAPQHDHMVSYRIFHIECERNRRAFPYSSIAFPGRGKAT
jgi:hypothetical protein